MFGTINTVLMFITLDYFLGWILLLEHVVTNSAPSVAPATAGYWRSRADPNAAWCC